MRERIRLAARIRYRKVMAMKILNGIATFIGALIVCGFLAILLVGAVVLVAHAIK